MSAWHALWQSTSRMQGHRSAKIAQQAPSLRPVLRSAGHAEQVCNGANNTNHFCMGTKIREVGVLHRHLLSFVAACLCSEGQVKGW